jgi:hypothetical protein
METILIYQNKDLKEDLEKYDYDSNLIIGEMVCTKIEKLGKDLNLKHFYSINITKIPTRTDYHLFSFEKLSEISRKLINGQNTLGSLTNRQFWSNFFLGGFRVIDVKTRESIDEFPSFTIKMIVFSEYDNLDVKISKNLSIRLRNIDPTLNLKLDYLGEYDRKTMLDEIPNFVPINCSEGIRKKLGEKTINQIFDLEFQTPRYFGRLFKINTL